MFGPEARFQCPEQQEAFDRILQTPDAHMAVCLPPGAGKTAVAMSPVVHDYVTGQDSRTLMFVVPHAPLVGHHVTTMERTLRGVCTRGAAVGDAVDDHFWVVGFTGKDISPSKLPDELTSPENMPHVVVLTIDAVASLTKHHPYAVKAMIQAGALGSVVIDEVQTVAEEVSFRAEPYESLRVVSTWGVRVVLLSGSLLPSIVTDIASWLRLRDDASQDGPFPIVSGGDPILSEVGFEIAEITSKTKSFVEGCAEMVAKRSETTSIHVVCARKAQADELEKTLRALFAGRDGAPVIAVITGESSTSDKIRVGRDWALGKVNIWITTSCGLEGNDNPLCKQVTIMGLPKNNSSLLQIIGRIRPSQGGPQSFVTQLIPQGSGNLSHYLGLCAKTDQEHLAHLYTTQKVLKDTPGGVAEELFTTRGVVELYQMPGCFLDNVRRRFGHRPDGKGCGRCTNCDRVNGTSAAQSQGTSQYYQAGGLCAPANTTIANPPRATAPAAAGPIAPASATSPAAKPAPPAEVIVQGTHAGGVVSPMSCETYPRTPAVALSGSKRPHHGRSDGDAGAPESDAPPAPIAGFARAPVRGSVPHTPALGGGRSHRPPSSSVAMSPSRKKLCAPTEASPPTTETTAPPTSEGVSPDARVATTVDPLLQGATSPATDDAELAEKCHATPTQPKKFNAHMEDNVLGTMQFQTDVPAIDEGADPFAPTIQAPADAATNASSFSDAAANALSFGDFASQSSNASNASDVERIAIGATRKWSDDVNQAKRAVCFFTRCNHACPFCLDPKCIGYCATKGLCSLCGEVHGRHNATVCPMTIRFRCRSCTSFATPSKAQWDAHKMEYGCTHYDIDNNLGKKIQDALKERGTCYMCFDWQCPRGHCCSSSKHKRNRIRAVLFRTAADSGIDLLTLVRAVYGSPSTRSKFFGSLPKAPLPTVLSYASDSSVSRSTISPILRWNPEEQCFDIP